MKSFSAKIHKIGINPYVGVPEDVLNALFKQAEKTKGPVQVRGTINRKKFKQTPNDAFASFIIWRNSR